MAMYDLRSCRVWSVRTYDYRYLSTIRYFLTLHYRYIEEHALEHFKDTNVCPSTRKNGNTYGFVAPLGNANGSHATSLVR